MSAAREQCGRLKTEMDLSEVGRADWPVRERIDIRNKGFQAIQM